MSVAALKWALSLPLKHPAKGVLLSLAWHANTEGQAWPSRAVIAQEIGVDVRTVVTAIKHLEDVGLISVERGSGRLANRYLVHVGAEAANPDPGSPSDRASGVIVDHR